MAHRLINIVCSKKRLISLCTHAIFIHFTDKTNTIFFYFSNRLSLLLSLSLVLLLSDVDNMRYIVKNNLLFALYLANISFDSLWILSDEIECEQTSHSIFFVLGNTKEISQLNSFEHTQFVFQISVELNFFLYFKNTIEFCLCNLQLLFRQFLMIKVVEKFKLTQNSMLFIHSNNIFPKFIIH